MAGPSDLESRVAALETQVHELTDRVQRSEQDAAAARVLAGGADRDVEQIRGEIRDFRQATISGLNALRENQREQGTQLQELTAEVRAKFDQTAAGQQQIADLLQRLIDQGEQ